MAWRCFPWSKLRASARSCTPGMKTESSPQPSGSGAERAAKAHSQIRGRNRDRWWRRCCSQSADRSRGQSPSPDDPEAALLPRPHLNREDRHSTASGNPRAGPHPAETSRRKPAANATPTPAPRAADACMQALQHSPLAERDPAGRTAPTLPDRRELDRSRLGHTNARSVAICSFRLRPLCSLYPASPISETNCFSTK